MLRVIRERFCRVWDCLTHCSGFLAVVVVLLMAKSAVPAGAEAPKSNAARADSRSESAATSQPPLSGSRSPVAGQGARADKTPHGPPAASKPTLNTNDSPAKKGRWFNSKLRMHVYELRDAPFGSRELYEHHCLGTTTGDERQGVYIPDRMRWAVHPIPDFESALKATIAAREESANRTGATSPPLDPSKTKFIRIDRFNSRLSEEFVIRLVREINDQQIPGLLLSKGQIDSSAIAIIKEAASLRSLRVSYCPLNAAAIAQLAALPRLESLDLDNAIAASNEVLSALGSLVHVKNLRIAGSTASSSNVEFTAHALSDLTRCRQLTKLILFSPEWVRRELITVLPSFPALRSLYLYSHYLDALTYEKIGNLGDLPQLADLTLLMPVPSSTISNGLAKSSTISRLSIQSISDNGRVQLPPNLTWFDLQYDDIESVCKLIQLPRSLRTIEISGAELNIDDIKSISQLPELRQLLISGCTIRDTDVAAALKQIGSLTQLRALALSGLRPGDTRFLAKLSNLQKIYLSGPNVRDADLVPISNLRTLRDVDVSHCTSLTDVAIGHLSELPSLSHLDLGGSRRRGVSSVFGYVSSAARITEGSAPYWREMKSLQFVNLQGTRVGDNVAESLSQLPSLITAVLDETKISSVGIRSLLNKDRTIVVSDLENGESLLPSLSRTTTSHLILFGSNDEIAGGDDPSPLVSRDTSIAVSILLAREPRTQYRGLANSWWIVEPS